MTPGDLVRPPKRRGYNARRDRFRVDAIVHDRVHGEALRVYGPLGSPHARTRVFPADQCRPIRKVLA